MTNNQSYTTSFTVNELPEVVFRAILDPRSWWSRTIEGSTQELGDVFVFQVTDVHRSVQKLVEIIPDKRVVWEVIDSNMTFIQKQDEWTGTKIVFDITMENDTTKLTFIHEGLAPEVECYKFCTPSWDQYITGSLYKLITTGTGTPNLEGATIDKPVHD